MMTYEQYLEVVTRIAANGEVYFGDEKLGGVIVDGGVTVRPEPGGLNRMTVTFFVGRVEIEDPTADGPPTCSTPEPWTDPTTYERT